MSSGVAPTKADATLRSPGRPETGFRSDGAPDRFMRRLFGVTTLDRAAARGAHNAFRISVVFSGIRCLITYLLIPVLVPVLSLAGWVAAPVGVALCVVAVVNGVVSMRRFWRSDHPQRWMYTLFMTVVFVVLAIALVSDFTRIGALT